MTFEQLKALAIENAINYCWKNRVSFRNYKRTETTVIVDNKYIFKTVEVEVDLKDFVLLPDNTLQLESTEDACKLANFLINNRIDFIFEEPYIALINDHYFCWHNDKLVIAYVYNY